MLALQLDRLEVADVAWMLGFPFRCSLNRALRVRGNRPTCANLRHSNGVQRVAAPVSRHSIEPPYRVAFPTASMLCGAELIGSQHLAQGASNAAAEVLTIAARGAGSTPRTHRPGLEARGCRRCARLLRPLG